MPYFDRLLLLKMLLYTLMWVFCDFDLAILRKPNPDSGADVREARLG